ncbi:outer membrane beta-barrel protein [Salinimonas marina]|uniref:Outer membrane beta-barrel protein n=1 Tax=Salinimonas marina TaxID=2785918 RepID=A0A7S9E104_9ALTE|nr:outer membrane beta-barrel protein [Salinimonas marina]QPG07045.1 outer membrane beta-barrel protein [Salinimonas marina]
MKRTFFAAVVAGLSMNAFAAQNFSSAPSWDYVEAGYQVADIDDAGDFEPAGYALAASAAVGENFFLKAAYRDLSEDKYGLEVELSQLTAGFGYRYSASKTTDLFGALTFERLDAEFSGGGLSMEGDDDGFGIEAGVRSMVIDHLELSAAVKHVELEEGDTGFEVGANFYITPNFAVGASYEARDDFDFVGADLRINF